MKMNIYNLRTKLSVVAFAVAGLLTLNSCEKENDGPNIVEEPIHLSCSYFSDNPNAVLEDNPNAPIDYIIDCKASLVGDVTIEPGVVIAFGQNAAITVTTDGSLSAVGTTSKPIVFTATNTQKGWWGGIEFRSNNNRNKLSYTTVEYAGGSDVSPGGGVGRGAVLVYATASLELTNSVLRNSADVGLSIAVRGGIGTHQPIIDGITLAGNTYTQNSEPMRIPFYLVGNLDANDDYSGNDRDRVLISGNLEQAQISMKAINVPYLTTGRLDIHRGSATGTVGRSHLTIEPGVILEMGDALGMEIRDGANFLTAAGTATDPITIRGRGGDSSPGSWGAIVFRHSDGPHNAIEHVNIRHGSSGAPAGNLSFRDEGLIRLNLNNSMTVRVNNVTFSEFSGTGCPVGYNGTLAQLIYSNLSDDQGRLPACIN